MSLVTQISAFVGAIIGIVSLWAILGIATSGDIRTLNRNQVETAIDLYQQKVESLLNAAPDTTTDSKGRRWEEELRKARAKLDASEARKIELSK